MGTFPAVRDRQPLYLKSSRPNDAFMCQWTRPSLVRIMACRLIGAKPLSEPMLVYCWLGPWEQFSVKFDITIFIKENEFENVVCKIALISYQFNMLIATPGAVEITVAVPTATSYLCGGDLLWLGLVYSYDVTATVHAWRISIRHQRGEALSIAFLKPFEFTLCSITTLTQS